RYIHWEMPKEKDMGTFTVRHGRRYRATISLGLLESLAGNDTIADRLRTAGFDDISVKGSASTRHAEARWPKNDATAEMPVQVSAVTEIEAAGELRLNLNGPGHPAPKCAKCERRFHGAPYLQSG